MGYSRAGFEVVGVDIKSQPRYPFECYRGDALSIFDWLPKFRWLNEFDAIHASPPCQAFTEAQRIRGRAHLDLLTPTRLMLKASGAPWVIENVPGAPMRADALLCGAMFDLGVYRHRLFETNFRLPFLLHNHGKKQAKMGRTPAAGEVMQVVGHFSGVAAAREAMGINWMTREELSQAIPPAYTEWIGAQLMAHLERAV